MKLKHLTTKQLKSYKQAIYNAILNKEPYKEILQYEYKKISIELHIREQGVKILKPRKPRKRRIMSERKKLIRRLTKEIGSYHLTQMMMKF